MFRDHRLYLDDILEAIGNIREYVAGLDYDAFARDKKTRHAVVRNLEIIGEAVRPFFPHLGPLPRGERWVANDGYLRKGLFRRSFLMVDVGAYP
jgi:hypothetical protein